MDIRLEHIGIVVEDIKEARRYYETVFGCHALSEVVLEPAHNVYVQFLDVGLGSKLTIELITPTETTSQVSSFLNKTGGGIHHLAYAVDDIEQAIEHFKAHRSIILGNIVHGAGHDSRTVWLYTARKELVELIEEKSDEI